MLDRIIVDPEIMGGGARIRGKRLPVSAIVTRIAQGASVEDVLHEYPDLVREDVSEALQYAAWLIREGERRARYSRALLIFVLFPVLLFIGLFAVFEARQRVELERALDAAEMARREAEADFGQLKRRVEENAVTTDRLMAELTRQKAEAEARQKAQAEERQKAEAEARQKAEAEERQKAEAEARQKAQAEAHQQAQAEARRKAEEERQKAEAEAAQKAEADAHQKAEEAGLPAFPWPPPLPSTRDEIDRQLLAPAGRTLMLRAVADKLESALQQAQYEYSFYGVPAGGFALVARLERITDKGEAVAGERRFLPPDAREPFDLTQYISALFFAPAGYYRMIALIVTDQPFVADTRTLDTARAKGLPGGGATALPLPFSERPFGPRYRVFALIYEFSKPTAAPDVTQLKPPGRLPTRTHLARSGLGAALGTVR